MRVPHHCVLLGVLALGLAGCGPATGTVSGTVNVDGAPLQNGTISFAAAEGQADPIAATITDGKYATPRMVVGKKLVQISAPVVVAKKPAHTGRDAPLMEVTKESLPPRFHSESTLTFEVKPGGNTKDWSLDTKDGKQ